MTGVTGIPHALHRTHINRYAQSLAQKVNCIDYVFVKNCSEMAIIPLQGKS